MTPQWSEIKVIKTLGKKKQKKHKKGGGEESSEMLSSRHDMLCRQMNSQQLWSPAPNCHKIQLVKNPNVEVGEVSEI